VVNKVNGKLFLDKRPSSEVEVNHSVHETNLDGLDADPEDVNSAMSLAREAKRAHEGFLTMAVNPSTASFSPLVPQGAEAQKLSALGATSEPPVSSGYVYRKWQLSDDLSIVVRCQVDAVNPASTPEQPKYELVRTLLEWNPKAMDWRTKLEQARGAVMATEIKNNAAKVARWTASAVLSGCETIHFGFASRTVATSNRNHLLLGSYLYRTKEFCTTINLNMANCWGVVKALAMTWEKLPDGKHLLIKDPAKTVLNLYQVPQSFFDEPQQ
jgi:translation initiation factor 3 subunit D